MGLGGGAKASDLNRTRAQVVNYVTAAETLNPFDLVNYITGETGGFTVTLPDPSEMQGETVLVRLDSITSGTVTIAQPDNSGADVSLDTAGQWVKYYGDGMRFYITETGTAADGTIFRDDLVLSSKNEINVQISGVGIFAIDDAAISSNAAAEDTAGLDSYVETQDGGTDGGTTSTGQVAGLLSFKTGDGSDAVTAAAVGGAGGALTIASGAGGNATTSATGGAGGAYAVTSGAGGTTATGTGGVGGAYAVTLGAGGAASAAGTGGAAGAFTVAGGIGGAGATATATGGAGSAITLTAGSGGVGSATGGAAGAIAITGGVGGIADDASSTGGVGSSVAITGGAGGASSGGSDTGGDGGTVTITAGTGGASSATQGDGGDVILTPGTGDTAGVLKVGSATISDASGNLTSANGKTSFTGSVATITVVNGIVTAASA